MNENEVERIQGLQRNENRHQHLASVGFLVLGNGPPNTPANPMSNDLLISLSTPNLVHGLQTSLIGLGHPLIGDGFFGPKTGEAFGQSVVERQFFPCVDFAPGELEQLQSRLGVKQDGSFGPITGKALGTAIASGQLKPAYRTCAEAVRTLKDFEKAGWERLDEFKSYLDMAGVPTIGFGHTGGVTRDLVKAGWAIAPGMAEQFLRKDLQRFERDVARLVTTPIGLNMFSACVLLAFNIGAGAFARSTACRLTNERDFEGAADAFLLFNKVTIGGAKRIAPGLTRRRLAEAALYRIDLC